MANTINAFHNGLESLHAHCSCIEPWDVARGGRRRWCWPFFKKNTYLLQLIAINEIESILVLLLLYSYNPRRPPAVLTRLLSTVDCRLSVSVAV